MALPVAQRVDGQVTLPDRGPDRRHITCRETAVAIVPIGELSDQSSGVPVVVGIRRL